MKATQQIEGRFEDVDRSEIHDMLGFQINMIQPKTNLFEYKEDIHKDIPNESLIVTHKNIPNMKYGEAETIREVTEYIANTYGEHYVGRDNIQVLDILLANSIASDFFQANAAKYILRYGKKSGYNRKDLLKAIHYIVLLLALDNNPEKSQ